MPMYFFDFEDGSTDRVAAEFADDAAAIQEAKLRALNGSAHQLPEHGHAVCIRVRNECGAEIHAVRINR